MDIQLLKLDAHTGVNRIAFIGNYVPRQCGIATFTTDLAEAITNQYPGLHTIALAMNDTDTGYAYQPRVAFELEENEPLSYQRAADYLNVNDIDVVCLQHEYGIFGGEAGRHILDLLKELRMPVVTTMHTVLRDPTPVQLDVTRELIKLSSRIIVMSQRGVDFLTEIYHAPADKIDFIHHGIPDIPFVDPNFYKDRFGVEGKTLLLTFGLLSPNKGIENVIQALPKVIERYPNLMYIVLGATHPNVVKHNGEEYRESLAALAERLGVSEHVQFDNRFVNLDELIEYIGAADIYITPYLNPAQITSGTLAYTLGAGKAVISTPYWYAEELLADDRGILVPFGVPEAISDQIVYLLEHEAERHAMRKRAYLYGREMIWSRVAQRYMESFDRARQEPVVRPMAKFHDNQVENREIELPTVNLYQLSRLTDSTGILQHAIYSLPNYNEGYTTDDNARALVVATQLEELGDAWFTGAEEFATRYLAFLWHAFDRTTGRFKNFMNYDRTWAEAVGSEDSHGRAIWGLGVVCGRSKIESMRSVSSILFNWALPKTVDFSSPRAWAFTILGIYEYLNRFEGDRTANGIGIQLVDRLTSLYQENNSADWHWFEGTVTYGNARLPHALIKAGQWLDQKEVLDIGLESLNWLVNIQRNSDGYFSPVGCNGFLERGGEKNCFDQQPIEAAAMVSACLEAYEVTGEHYWYHEATRAFEWFLGANQLGLSLYDPKTGGCRDGLHPDRVNQNQGAESTLGFLYSLLLMRSAHDRQRAQSHPISQPITIMPVKSGVTNGSQQYSNSRGGFIEDGDR